MSLLRANGGGLGGAGAPGGALGSFYSHSIDQSLKFEDGDSAYLNRTPSSAGNRKTFTFSCWVKRGNLGEQALLDAYSDDSNRTRLMFDAGNRFQFFTRLSGADHSLICNAVCRDLSAWYHVVFSVDTTQSTASNRVKIYINGESQTFTGTDFPDDENTFINHTVAHSIGSANDSGGREIYFDGYLAEINMIDGTALTADSFGETKDGVWVAKQYSGGHGNNGFHLPFSVTQGSSVNYSGTTNISWTNTTQYDIASDDDFCLEFFTKGNDFESGYSYSMGDYAVGGPHFMLQLGPGGNIYGYYGNGLVDTFDASGYLTSTDWHHFAWVRDDGTVRFYIDGVQRGTGTNGATAAHNISQFYFGDAYAAGGAAHLLGTFSNLRLTIGAARYESGTTFTVPTSTLTNDSSNVKLLAFTTSTLTADASTAAVTGSILEGTPVHREDSPFSAILGKDAAGSNDFSDSGLFFRDVVPDSPTNNFATLNPLAKSQYASLSEGNLKIAWSNYASANLAANPSTITLPRSGKWYFELSNASGDGNNGIGIGICNATQIANGGNATPTNYYLYRSDAANTFNGYYSDTGNAGSLTTFLGSSPVCGIAVDLDAGKFWAAVNNTWQGSGSPNPATGADAGFSSISTSVTWVPFVAGWEWTGSATTATVNFGQDSSFAGGKTSGSAFATDGNNVGDFYYTPPSGFLALCSSNLPDVTIGPGQSSQADDHFNTVLWTGNGATGQTITTGLSPDFVWVKSRSAGYDHGLQDTVRGATKDLNSNDTQAEETRASSITSFTSTGFVLGGNDVIYNESSGSHVAWNWKAGGAAPTKTYKVVVDNDGANKYRFRNSANGATFATYAPTIELQEGGTYVFDWSDDGTNGAVSAQGHPIRFSTTSNGTWGGGSEYTTGVVKDDSAYTTTITVAASAPTLYYYCQNHSGMGGQVNTNATFGSSYFDGSILSTVSANTDAGFSIISYTGNGSSGQTVAHGLSSAPEFIIHKDRDTNGNNNNWNIYHASAGDDYGYFTTTGFTGSAQIIPSGTTTIELKANLITTNESGDDFIMYAFHSVEGYLKVGSYTGNGVADGPFVYTGFKPAWVMVKRKDSTGWWGISDSARSTYNEIANTLAADQNYSESTLTSDLKLDFLSNGFKIRDTDGYYNASGGTYIYLAFAEQPFKFANAQ